MRLRSALLRLCGRRDAGGAHGGRRRDAGGAQGGRRRDAGSMSIELVLIVPMLLGVLALVFAYARVSIVSANFDAGVRDAARAATQERDYYSAQQVAEESLRTATARASQGCADSLQVTPIDTFQPGMPVTVEATCEYPMVDVMGFLPGTMTFSSSFTSPLDPNRGIDGQTS